MTETKTVTHPSSELLDDVRESARTGQHAASEALAQFRKTLDESIPESIRPLRQKIVDAAIELADQLVAAQYQFNRNLVRSVDNALNSSEREQQ